MLFFLFLIHFLKSGICWAVSKNTSVFFTKLPFPWSWAGMCSPVEMMPWGVLTKTSVAKCNWRLLLSNKQLWKVVKEEAML